MCAEELATFVRQQARWHRDSMFAVGCARHGSLCSLSVSLALLLHSFILFQ